MVPATDETNTPLTALTPGGYPGGVSYLELATLPSAPYWARQQTQAVLKAWQLPAETVRTSQLVVSELVTNSIQATGPSPASRAEPNRAHVARIALTLRQQPGRIVIEVFDTHPAPPLPADPDPDAETGRGLMLVQALSKEWGHFFHPSGGKTVYAIIGTAENSQHPDNTTDM
jgi:anti-sigma regulatory factor (Ser/Thr protein kinase)